MTPPSRLHFRKGHAIAKLLIKIYHVNDQTQRCNQTGKWSQIILTDERKQIIIAIYRAQNKSSFCPLVINNSIDYVEFPEPQFGPTPGYIKILPYFSALDENSKPVLFIDVKKACKEQ